MLPRRCAVSPLTLPNRTNRENDSSRMGSRSSSLKKRWREDRAFGGLRMVARSLLRASTARRCFHLRLHIKPTTSSGSMCIAIRSPVRATHRCGSGSSTRPAPSLNGFPSLAMTTTWLVSIGHLTGRCCCRFYLGTSAGLDLLKYTPETKTLQPVLSEQADTWVNLHHDLRFVVDHDDPATIRAPVVVGAVWIPGISTSTRPQVR